MSLGFLEYFFRGACDFSKVITGSAQPQITRQTFAPVKIKIPPLPEQRRIVAVLDEAFEGLSIATTNTEKNLKNAREVFESYLNSVFVHLGHSSRAVTLGSICELQNGFAFKSDLFRDSGTPVLRISSIQDNLVCDNRPVYVNPPDYTEDLSRFLVRSGDLLIAMSGATTGKIGFNRTGIEYLLNQRVGKFEPSNKLNIEFLYYFLRTKAEESLSISAGSAQPNLSTKQIKEFLIPLPAIEEQLSLVAGLDAVQEQCLELVGSIEKKLAAIAELKQSLLQKAFAGELTKDLNLYNS